MFDTMVLTKVVAALCATLLFFLVGKWAAETIYLPAHGDHHAAVYPIIEEDDGADAVEVVEEAVDVMALYAEADAAAGEGLWRNCRACHSLEEGQNGTGPTLHGVVGRPIDGVDGFNYSGALLALGDTWTVEALDTFLENPREAAPGTRMSYRGLSSIDDRLNLIAYLEAASQ
ncbi:c-type cytochrome [Pararhodobacter oceanensis]|uniref:Cytochrome c family protein n=1 Tax=Pararhodobacter oceanensis TaxID=2172121 RepID=A0A2T8HR09_9RHOB|nr:c-type cytochrome [Pararhodobacter oceanensis]PVH27879.1 cytochrome c family protein [Pararhodobacter oceanensis]